VNKRLVILGAGGHGRVVADIAEQQGFEHIEFLDSRYPEITHNLHWLVVGKNISEEIESGSTFVAIGDNAKRLLELDVFLDRGLQCPVLVHPSASVSLYATVGPGSIVMANAVINAGAKLGRGVIVNSGCTIDHDCVIGNGVHISPGANIAGGVRVGDLSWICIGSCVKENVIIGRNVVAAAGCVVISSVADGERVFGVPARTRGALKLC
jgi:sugar O-acyltransferase (sialic acid O-acetyltransferase NeuD family)